MRIGIDLGGTKIAGIVLGADGNILHQQRLATPQGDYQGTRLAPKHGDASGVRGAAWLW